MAMITSTTMISISVKPDSRREISMRRLSSMDPDDIRAVPGALLQPPRGVTSCSTYNRGFLDRRRP
jgi:hypothetical protein